MKASLPTHSPWPLPLSKQSLLRVIISCDDFQEQKLHNTYTIHNPYNPCFCIYGFIYTIFLPTLWYSSEVTTSGELIQDFPSSLPWMPGEATAYIAQVRQDFLDGGRQGGGPLRWDQPSGAKRKHLTPIFTFQPIFFFFF